MKLNLKNVGVEADTTNFHDKTYLRFKLIIVVKTRNVKKLKFLFPLSISFSVISTLPEFFYMPEHIFPDLSYTVSQYFMTLALQEVNNFESSVVVQELEFAMNLAYMVLYEAWVTNTS